MRRYFFIFFAIGLLSLTATTASADFIDFSSSDFEEAGAGVNSYTDDDLGMTITAKPEDAVLSWNSEYGLGVDSQYWGEIPEQIDACEYLIIDFSETVYLATVDLTNLYNEYAYLEMGYYILNDGTIDNFYADFSEGWGSNGEQTLTINQDVTAIAFTAYPFFGDHDYSVKGINISAASGNSNTSVPELDAESSVSALALLFGCVLVSNSRRRLML